MRAAERPSALFLLWSKPSQPPTITRAPKPFNGLREKREPMFLILALVLFLAWIGGFVVFHTAGFLIHILLIFAVISVIFHFLRGRSSTV
jgi:hypothetical protein